MCDEVLARTPLLIGVAFAREGIRLLDRAAVDAFASVVDVLFEDREKVPQKRAFVGVEALGVLVVGDGGGRSPR